MGDDGGYKDERGGTQGKRLMLPHRDKNLVGGAAAIRVKMLVQEHDDQAAQRQQIDQPRVSRAQGGRFVERQPKHCAKRPHYTAHQRSQDHPFKADIQVPQAAAQIPQDFFHRRPPQGNKIHPLIILPPGEKDNICQNRTGVACAMPALFDLFTICVVTPSPAAD